MRADEARGEESEVWGNTGSELVALGVTVVRAMGGCGLNIGEAIRGGGKELV